MTANSKPRRRWFQFSFRTLLVLMLLVCIGMSWIAVKMQQARKQRAAVTAIVRLGGRLLWEDVDSEIESRGLAWLQKLLGERFAIRPDVVEINNDAAMEYLTELTHAPNLVLIGTQVTDAGLEHLKGLTQLKTLSIKSTPVTDAGLEHLTALTQLTSLDLSGAQVTDAGLKHLKGLTQLRWLFLDGTRVTDAGSEHLKGLSKLEQLKLTDTQVSDSGVSTLQQVLPNCNIIR